MKMSEKICFMILTGISIFLVGIFNVKADSGLLVLNGDSGTSFVCSDASNTNNCNSIQLDYFRKNNKTWLHYNAPNNYFYNQNNYVSYFVNNNMQAIDTRNYDYILIHIITYGGIVPNSITVGNTYGYNMGTNITQNICFNSYQTGSGDICYDSVYDNIMKIDTTTNNSVGGQFKIYFSANGGGYVTDNSRIFIEEQIYLGKSSDKNAQEIRDKMYEDIDNDSKTAPNQDEYDQAEEKQNTILEGISDASPDDITFTQDINATGTIWNLIDNIVNTNAKIIGLIISILSIGLIKLILAR